MVRVGAVSNHTGVSSMLIIQSSEYPYSFWSSARCRLNSFTFASAFSFPVRWPAFTVVVNERRERSKRFMKPYAHPHEASNDVDSSDDSATSESIFSFRDDIVTGIPHYLSSTILV